jgi:hypothetical protein
LLYLIPTRSELLRLVLGAGRYEVSPAEDVIYIRPLYSAQWKSYADSLQTALSALAPSHLAAIATVVADVEITKSLLSPPNATPKQKTGRVNLALRSTLRGGSLGDSGAIATMDYRSPIRTQQSRHLNPVVLPGRRAIAFLAAAPRDTLRPAVGLYSLWYVDGDSVYVYLQDDKRFPKYTILARDSLANLIASIRR